MKKFFTGMIAGILLTLYVFSSLGSVQSSPSNKSTGLKEAREVWENAGDDATQKSGYDSVYKENVKIYKKQDLPKPGPGKAPDHLSVSASQIIEETSSLPHYKMNLIGPAGKNEGKVLISSDKSVWCDLKTLSASMGWKLTPDGEVYSTSAEHTLLFRIDNQRLISAKDQLFISLSYLKNMWLLDFSVNPARHTLELS